MSSRNSSQRMEEGEFVFCLFLFLKIYTYFFVIFSNDDLDGGRSRAGRTAESTGCGCWSAHRADFHRDFLSTLSDCPTVYLLCGCVMCVCCLAVRKNLSSISSTATRWKTGEALLFGSLSVCRALSLSLSVFVAVQTSIASLIATGLSEPVINGHAENRLEMKIQISGRRGQHAK